MNYRNIYLFISLILPSIAYAEQNYEVYKDAVSRCIDNEKKKPPLRLDDIATLKPNDIEKYLLVIKDIRIQKCTSLEEVQALSHELVSFHKFKTDELEKRYLSIYIENQLKNYSNSELNKLKDIELMLEQKSLEINMIDILEQLKNK